MWRHDAAGRDVTGLYGLHDPSDTCDCDKCEGSGEMRCPRCNGSGEGMADGSRCLDCKGSGMVDCDGEAHWEE